MELDWSAQSPHIRTLFHPWQPGDGYDEATLQEAETRLGLRLPATLRNFYLAWGQRRDMTDKHHSLLAPNRLGVQADALVICAENQASWLWAVRCEALEEVNPPVVVGYPEHVQSKWRVPSSLSWMPFHAHLSDFLDDFTYLHAFFGGALHGGHTTLGTPSRFQAPFNERQIAWLEQHWRKASVAPIVSGLLPDEVYVYDVPPPLYVRDGQAIVWKNWCRVAVCEAEALDEIAQALQIKWVRRW